MKPKNSKTNRIQPPDLPRDLASPPAPIEQLEKGERYSEVALSEWDVSGQSAAAVAFDSLTLERSNLSATVLRRLTVRDARIKKCDLSNADWSYATMDRVEFLDGRLTGLKAIEAKFRDVRFVDCKADLALFRYGFFKDARFESCNLREADFQGADLRGVGFYGCDLRGANFSGAKLEKADLRGAQLEGLLVLPADLKGAIIDQGQVLELSGTFAMLLGLNVLD